MPQNFKIDQAATFESVLFLSCEAKTAFGDQYRQETTKDGLPKWQLQLVGRFRQFGRATNEIINVGIVAEGNPAEDLTPATPVHLIDFEIGVMDRKDRDGKTSPAPKSGTAARTSAPSPPPAPPDGAPASRRRSPRRRRRDLADPGGVPRRRPGAVLPRLRRRHERSSSPAPGSPSRRSARRARSPPSACGGRSTLGRTTASGPLPPPPTAAPSAAPAWPASPTRSPTGSPPAARARCCSRCPPWTASCAPTAERGRPADDRHRPRPTQPPRPPVWGLPRPRSLSRPPPRQARSA